MEVFFLDVAQGTCQVLLLGNRSAIVLDSGARNGRVPLQFLKRMGIDHIAALITTHSHDDHMGGATAILGEYQDMIDVIGFVKDDQFLATSFWRGSVNSYTRERSSETSLPGWSAIDHRKSFGKTSQYNQRFAFSLRSRFRICRRKPREAAMRLAQYSSWTWANEGSFLELTPIWLNGATYTATSGPFLAMFSACRTTGEGCTTTKPSLSGSMEKRSMRA